VTLRPVRVIVSYMYGTPFGLIFLAKNGYRSITELKRKKIGMVKNEAPALLLGAYLKASGMKLSDFTMVEVEPKEKFKL
jgi:ABC-type nitrate/sulfonate/bicarbonate transport system substrate-binding protein